MSLTNTSEDVVCGLDVDTVVRAYLTCAAWASTVGEDDTPCDDLGLDFSLDALERAENDVRVFLGVCKLRGIDLETCGLDAKQVGHDLWLTRNGHGAGFWDRGLGATGEALSALARDMGMCDVYVGDEELELA